MVEQGVVKKVTMEKITQIGMVEELRGIVIGVVRSLWQKDLSLKKGMEDIVLGNVLKRGNLLVLREGKDIPLFVRGAERLYMFFVIEKISRSFVVSGVPDCMASNVFPSQTLL